jgi:PrsW family intramembrane metalloprotease
MLKIPLPVPVRPRLARDGPPSLLSIATIGRYHFPDRRQERARWHRSTSSTSIADGIVYGALVGLGFKWFEATLYVAQNYAEYEVAPYGLQLGSRYAMFGLGGHALFTGIFGASLGLALQTRRMWLRKRCLSNVVLARSRTLVTDAQGLLAAVREPSFRSVDAAAIGPRKIACSVRARSCLGIGKGV